MLQIRCHLPHIQLREFWSQAKAQLNSVLAQNTWLRIPALRSSFRLLCVWWLWVSLLSVVECWLKVDSTDSSLFDCLTGIDFYSSLDCRLRGLFDFSMWARNKLCFDLRTRTVDLLGDFRLTSTYFASKNSTFADLAIFSSFSSFLHHLSTILLPCHEV